MTNANDDKTLVSADFNNADGAASDPDSLGEPERTSSAMLESHQMPRRTSTSPFLTTERFVEREIIGRGGMALVIRAYDKELQRDVAIKVLPQDAVSEADIGRLMDEARITGGLDHPHVIPVYEFGCDDRGTRFLCMKLVQGETLEDTLAWAGASRLEPEFLAKLLQIFIKVCDAVAFAHSRGVLHRDLKPSNVMISDFGQVYVVDWGVARTTPGSSAEVECELELAPCSDPFGVIVGTPRYMAPEQLHGEHDRLDERTDVFALGATLYQILTGQPPHHPDSLPDIALRKARVTIPPPEEVVAGAEADGRAQVPQELSRIALKAMAHDPADRYASVDELSREVECFQRGPWLLPRTRFQPGAIIVNEGERGDCAFIILEGRCLAFRRDGDGEVALREMGPGDVFGETAIIANTLRTASVRALDDVVLLVVTGDTLVNSLGLNRWIGSFVRALADRFCERDERVRELERRTRTTRPPPPHE
jgi:eukaryotic-like serine/threonine-protein kinase